MRTQAECVGALAAERNAKAFADAHTLLRDVRALLLDPDGDGFAADRMVERIDLILEEKTMKLSTVEGYALDCLVAKCEDAWVRDGADDDCPEYSTSWEQGGPIIEREWICLIPPHADVELWEAYHPEFGRAEHYGSTPLIAAMRCYVAAKLGDIPEEERKSVVKCALSDLIGAWQAYSQNDIHAHDWRAHVETIREVAMLLGEELPTELVEGAK